MAEMVKVRIALAVDPDGAWCAAGDHWRAGKSWNAVMYGENDVVAGQQRYWVTLEVPKPGLPEPTEIAVKAEATQ